MVFPLSRLSVESEDCCRHDPAQPPTGQPITSTVASGDRTAQPHPTRLSPRQCALLIIDFQPALLVGVQGQSPLLERTNTVARKVRQLGGRVIFTRLAFNRLDYLGIPGTNRRFTAVATARALDERTPAAGLHPDLISEPDDIFLRKQRLSAFARTRLDEQLTNLGVTTLALCGLTTSGAVLSTLTDASDRDYGVVVLSDCVADPDPAVNDLLVGEIFPRESAVLCAEQFGAIIDLGVSPVSTQSPSS